MSLNVFYIVCMMMLITRDVIAFDFIRDFIFPRYPMVKKVRYINDGARFFDDDSTVLDTVGLVEKHGYPAEQHIVTTEDGYNIILFRIPGNPRSSVKKKGKPVVFIMHGMLASSDCWVLLGPEKDLPFLLADAGYDVWLGNTRGNCYGRSHTVLSPRDKEFWDFSFHEIGVWDLPKMIDYTLELTDQKSLFYIGHSMGTTSAYILLSERPEYNDKIRLFVALAPIAFWHGPPNPFVKILAANGNTLKRVLDDNGIFDILPQTSNNGRIARALCSDESKTQPICIQGYFIFGGEDVKQLNRSLLPHFFKYVPAGVSTKTLTHYQQNMISGTFQLYDNGHVENFRLYGKRKPPIYDVKKITAPNALLYGKNDILSLESNILELTKRLQNIVTLEPVRFDSFNHLDFMWAINAKELLFDRIIEILSNYTRRTIE